MSGFSWQQKWLALTPKSFAVLSMMGSLYIIKHVLSRKSRRSAVYHRVLLGLSIYDLMTSSAVFMGTWPIPAGTSGVFLASGNEMTCSAQGFFIQLGVGTPLYNASLAIYYVFVVLRGWNNDQLKKIEPYLHGFPICFSLTTAIVVASNDSYRNSNVWCWITSANTGYRFGFFYGPVWGAMVIVTIAMVLIYLKVLIQERKAARWRHPERSLRRKQLKPQTQQLEDTRRASIVRAGISKKSTQSRKIASQALFYVGSFYLTFVFPSWTRIAQMMTGSSPFSVLALFAVFFPMQGFFNAMVYFRPRYLRFRRDHPDISFLQILYRVFGSIVQIQKSMLHESGNPGNTGSRSDDLDYANSNSGAVSADDDDRPLDSADGSVIEDEEEEVEIQGDFNTPEQDVEISSPTVCKIKGMLQAWAPPFRATMTGAVVGPDLHDSSNQSISSDSKEEDEVVEPDPRNSSNQRLSSKSMDEDDSNQSISSKSMDEDDSNQRLSSKSMDEDDSNQSISLNSMDEDDSNRSTSSDSSDEGNTMMA